MSASVPFGARMNRLIMLLMLAAAEKNDQEILRIVYEMYKVFKQSLEEGEQSGQGKS